MVGLPLTILVMVTLLLWHPLVVDIMSLRCRKINKKVLSLIPKDSHKIVHPKTRYLIPHILCDNRLILPNHQEGSTHQTHKAILSHLDIIRPVEAILR